MGEMGESWEQSSFYLALRSPSCTGTAMIIDEQALPLTRSWCLFELLQTFLLCAEAPSRFEGLLLCSHTGILNYGGCGVDFAMALAERVATLDLRDASATSAEDDTM